MLPDYRHDKWPSLFSDVLLKTMRCALLSASVTDFISCSLEALSFKINYTPNERIIVLENLWKVLQVSYKTIWKNIEKPGRVLQQKVIHYL